MLVLLGLFAAPSLLPPDLRLLHSCSASWMFLTWQLQVFAVHLTEMSRVGLHLVRLELWLESLRL